jgi:predicted dehydrogenase
MIDVSLFGYGYWGKILFREISKSGLFQVRHVVDPYLSEEDKAFLISNDVLINLAIEEIDSKVAIIAIPATGHFELVKHLINNGWDVLCEKPLCTVAKDSELLIKLARERQMVLAVGHTYMHHDAIKRIKSELVSSINQDGLNPKACTLISYRLAPGPIRYDVGAHWDLAAHDLSIFLFLMGSKEVTISQAQGFRRSKDLPWDFVSITVVDERLNQAYLHVGWLSPVKIRQLQVYTEQLSIQYDEVLDPTSIRVVKIDKPNQAQPIELGEGKSPVQNEIAYFYHRIKGRRLDDYQLEIAKKVVEILANVEKMLES